MGQVETFAYNTDGTLATKTDFNGDTVSYFYDSEKRLTETHYPDTTSIIRVYEPVSSRLISETDQNGTTSYEYYLNGSLRKVTNPDGTWISYTYDKNGNKLTVSTANGVTTYSYDPLSRISTVSDLQNRITSYNYDSIGRFETVTYPNGIVETKNFDELGRTVSVVNTRGVDIVSSYDYELDALGNKTRVTEMSGKVTEYSYDVLNRLTLESVTDNGQTSSIGYQHDSVGNRTVKEDCDFEGCVSVSYTYDANDRMTSDGVKTYIYDNNGNMLSDGTLTYAYNYDNRMISAGTTDYIYNTRGIRTSKTVSGETTKYIVDTNKSYPDVVEELDSSNILKTRYEIGEKLISQTKNGSTSFYHYDGFGSTRALADDIGIITDTYDYNSFGVITSQTGTTDNNYLYRNEQYDSETGTYYLRARQYSPGTGRFTQMDSWAGNQSNPITLNKYLYGDANPIMFVDPSGHMSLGGMMAGLKVQYVLAAVSVPVGAGIGYGVTGNWKGAVWGGTFGAVFGLSLITKTTPKVIFGAILNVASLFGRQYYLNKYLNSPSKYPSREAIVKAAAVGAFNGFYGAKFNPGVLTSAGVGFGVTLASTLDFEKPFSEQKDLIVASFIVGAIGGGLSALPGDSTLEQFISIGLLTVPTMFSVVIEEFFSDGDNGESKKEALKGRDPKGYDIIFNK